MDLELIIRLFDEFGDKHFNKDDPGVALAFNRDFNPMGARLNAMFSSDMGHWDGADVGAILAEAHELVEKGLIDDNDFRDFVCNNPIRFYTRMNPNFFDGTRVEDVAKQVVAKSLPSRP